MLFDGGSVAGLSDRQLLERFVAGRDPAGEAAFAALVARHGPMVLGVCRQLLGDRHHAEDAFQAVFLVLARKARIAPRARPAGQLALRRRAPHGPQGARPARAPAQDRGAMRPLGRPESHLAAPAEQVMLDREQAEALHREIDRLPGAFRAAVVLCYLEGLSLDEAAHGCDGPRARSAAGWSGRATKLRRGLARRGVALPAVALAAVLAPRSASASVSSLLCDTTTRAAIGFAARSRRGRRALRLRRGPGPGGPPYHAVPQAEAHRDLRLAPRRRRHRRRLPQPIAGQEG